MKTSATWFHSGNKKDLAYVFFKAMVNAAGIAGVSQDFNGQGRKLDEVSQSTDLWSPL